ncbi:MAG: AAA family ATPase [Bacteroidales bacterium]|nr:AAA family ATPase [Bacteroidales bacterium]
MIIGVILKKFKCYKDLHYIPLTNADGANFCGLIGLNGAGKSAVLEALDCFFNQKSWKQYPDSLIIPIFAFDSDDKYISKEERELLHQFSNLAKRSMNIWSLTDLSNELYGKILLPIAMQCDRQFEMSFYEEMDKLISSNEYFRDNYDPEDEFDSEYYDETDYYFYKEQRKKYAESLTTYLLQDCITELTKIMDIVMSRFYYIYIPKEIVPERFAQFETQEIQHLIGLDLVSVVRQGVSEKIIREIDNKLNEFVRNTSANMKGYQFKSNSNGSSTLKVEDIYNFLAHNFFSKIELKKNVRGKYISMSQLSSGEKQQAIMALIYSTIMEQENRKLIIAIDEPEASLHISERFDQFQKLYEISHKCCQVLFTSHWYGFIPALPNGVVINVVVEQNKHKAAVLNVDNYRGEINNEQFPFDITLKGNNDLIQSIMNSVNGNDYNWIICEGVSDKKYLDEYLKDEITNSQTKLRIVSVIGCTQVENIYRLLLISLQDYKKGIKGKIFLLTDTDANINYTDKYNMPKSANIPNVVFKRLVNDKKNKTTHLTDYYSSYNTTTAIEDVLNGKTYAIVLNKLIKDCLQKVKNEIKRIEALRKRYEAKEKQLLQQQWDFANLLKDSPMPIEESLDDFEILEDWEIIESPDDFDSSTNFDQDNNTENEPYVENSIKEVNEETIPYAFNYLDYRELRDIGYDPKEEKAIKEKEKNLEMLDLITNNLNIDELLPSAFALKDVKISDTEKEALSAFLKSKKTDFARAYVEEIQKGGYKEPSWITEIKNFFK